MEIKYDYPDYRMKSKLIRHQFLRIVLRVVIILPIFLILICNHVLAQADNEIQVYASPTIQHKWTIFELHSNYTLQQKVRFKILLQVLDNCGLKKVSA